jgi:aspartate/methionine/tyrosine aminotransferase
MSELAVDLDGLILRYGDHPGTPELRAAIAADVELMTPRTKLVSLTSPHNPTGSVMSEATLREVIALVEGSGARDPRSEWLEPAGGVVGFPRIRPEVDVDVDRFYEVLLEEHGTVVGPGHWFEQSRRHFRLGYGWPQPAELEAGLAGLSQAVREA